MRTHLLTMLRVSLSCLLLVCLSAAEPGHPFLEEEERDGGSDSLRPALEAISRRQRDLRTYDNYGGLGRYRYEPAKRDGDQLEFLTMGDGQPEDIGYGYQRGGAVVQQGGSGRDQNALLERLLMEYLDGSSKRSAFRERAAKGPSRTAFRERAEEADKKKRFMALVKRLEDEEEEEEGEDDRKKRGEEERKKGEGEVEEEERKRRGDGNCEDGEEKKEEKRDDYDYFNSPFGWMGSGGVDAYGRRRRDQQKLRYLYRLLEPSAYGNQRGEGEMEDGPRESEGDENTVMEARRRRFPVAKRALQTKGEEGMKRRKKEAKTEPKVAAALSHIFSDSKSNETEEKKKEEEKKEEEKKEVKEDVKKEVKKEGEKERVDEVSKVKKSVDWSEYFGMDRRKKKWDGEEEDGKLDQFLLDQYYRLLSENMARRKIEGREEEDNEEDPLGRLEDAIVEEAIKDTGAHEGGERREVEDAKARVLTRLAAAYGLEKMRKALAQGKGERISDGYPMREAEVEEKKRDEGVFVGPPINEPMQEGNKDDDADESECPALERLTTNCEGIGDMAGDYLHLFLDLCNWHEVCTICGSSSPGGPLSSCDLTFLREVDSLCHGHEDCRQSGHRMALALRALRGRPPHHQAKSANLCWQHPCLADYVARKRR